jgi:hypothetical protein
MRYREFYIHVAYTVQTYTRTRTLTLSLLEIIDDTGLSHAHISSPTLTGPGRRSLIGIGRLSLDPVENLFFTR